MSFIADVIYGLKMEYGEEAVLEYYTNQSINKDTGIQTKDIESIFVPKLIPLPVNIRRVFFLASSGHKEGILQQGEREFLIDADDLPKQLKIDDGIIFNNERYIVSRKPEIYDEACIIVAKALSSFPNVHEITMVEPIVVTETVTNA